VERYLWINQAGMAGTSESQGSCLVFEISPYDMPRGVVGKYLAEKGVFVISFEYIDDEPAVIQKANDGIELHQGKFSGKALKLVIPASLAHLGMTLCANAVMAVGHSAKRSKSCTMNRRLTQGIIRDRFSDLATGVVPGYAYQESGPTQ
jgi:hypothetical protein